jgi:3-oxoadipate enol-lactonase
VTTTFVEVPGARLQVLDEGRESDPPLLLLHAGIADLRSWDALAPKLLDAEYRVLRFDARGTGGTESDSSAAFSRIDDVLAVLDAHDIDRAVLIGNSLGGQTAIDTAIRAPDRVAAVVGVAAGLGGYDGGATPLEARLLAEMEALESADPPDPAAVADIDVRVWVDGPGQPPDRVPAAIRDHVREMDMASYLPGHEAGELIRLSPPAIHRLAELKCPVLAVAGLLDVSEVVATARYIEANAPNARAEIWPHVAHMIGMEVPDELAAEIVEFLAPLPRWS